MERALEHFIGYLSLERGLVKNSVLAYRSDLSDFIAYLKARSISSYMAVTRDDIIDYLSDCKDRGMEVATLARRLVAIKVFFRYLFQERIIGADITDVMDSRNCGASCLSSCLPPRWMHS